MLLNLRLLKPVWATSWQAQLCRKLEVKCIMLCAVRFGPMSGLPFWHHISQISFSLSHFNLLVGDTLTHFVLGNCGPAVSLCNTTFLPISPALPFPLNFPVVCYCFTRCIDLCSSGSFFLQSLNLHVCWSQTCLFCVCVQSSIHSRLLTNLLGINC